MPDKNITRVKVFCRRCYKYHVFLMEDLHPQMVEAYFICPTYLKTDPEFKAPFERLKEGQK